MALSALRLATRPSCLMMRCTSLTLAPRSAPMASSAQDQMKEFWKRNQERNRPNSPWIIYNWHFPMMTSLTHRFTGIAMGVVLYGTAMGMAAYPGEFASIVESIKALEIPTAAMFTVKGLCAFPLMYHSLNGIRHLAWDAGVGYKLSMQYKSGMFVYSAAILMSILAASVAYW